MKGKVSQLMKINKVLHGRLNSGRQNGVREGGGEEERGGGETKKGKETDGRTRTRKRPDRIEKMVCYWG